MNLPLMPKATAVWLIENTTLTFDQVADFCGMHPLEVKGIADGDVATGIMGVDPVAAGQLTAEEIRRAEADGSARLKMVSTTADYLKAQQKKNKGRYTPVARRQDKPDAIAWIVKTHPEVSDAQISKLIGTTKTTIQAIRERSHWNMTNIRPRDPVLLGLCTQTDLHAAVSKAQEGMKRAEEKAQRDAKKDDSKSSSKKKSA